MSQLATCSLYFCSRMTDLLVVGRDATCGRSRARGSAEPCIPSPPPCPDEPRRLAALVPPLPAAAAATSEAPLPASTSTGDDASRSADSIVERMSMHATRFFTSSHELHRHGSFWQHMRSQSANQSGGKTQPQGQIQPNSLSLSLTCSFTHLLWSSYLCRPSSSAAAAYGIQGASQRGS